MKSPNDIIILAEDKLKDADCLFENSRFASAYYLAGYVIELLLKARVCMNLGINDIFDFDNLNRKRLNVDNNLNRSLKVHDYDQLLVLSGLHPFYEQENNNVYFKADWSIISQWSQHSRYLTEKTETEVKDFITSIKNVKSWIEKYL